VTASIQNTASSFKMLKKAVSWFRKATDRPVDERVWHIEIQLDSFEKCMTSLTAQIRFYQSAKSPTRALIITEADGSERHVSGQSVETLCLHLPGEPEDAVVYGKPETLKRIAAALEAHGKTVTGPAPIADHAAKLGEAPPETEKARFK